MNDEERKEYYRDRQRAHRATMTDEAKKRRDVIATQWRLDHLDEWQLIRQRQTTKHRGTKHQAVMYKGGKCQRCRATVHDAAFDFHHVGGEKDDNISTLLRRASWDVLVVELDKCELLCANCHRTHHAIEDGWCST